MTPSKTSLFEIITPSLSIKSQLFSLGINGQVQFEEPADIETMEKLHFFKIVFEESDKLIRSKNRAIQPAKIEINTNDFYSAHQQNKYGFGSSAAITVALTKALLSSTDLLSEFTEQKFFQIAFQIHRKAQNNLGSGIDVAASVYGNVLTYQLSEENGLLNGNCQLQDLWKELYVIPIWAGHSTSTREMVRNVDAFKESSPQIFDRIMNDLIKCSEKGCVSYIEKDKIALYESINEFNRILSDLGKQSRTPIISEAHSRLIDLVTNESTVYKPSGAGGGDIGVAFCDSPDALENIKQILKNSEFRVLDIGIAKKGVTFSI
jgi:phosphomevalonate kinase